MSFQLSYDNVFEYACCAQIVVMNEKIYVQGKTRINIIGGVDNNGAELPVSVQTVTEHIEVTPRQKA